MKRNVIITGTFGNLDKASMGKFLEDGFKVIATMSPGKKTGL